MDDVNLLRDVHEIGFNSSYEDFGEASSEEELEIQQPTEEWEYNEEHKYDVS